IVGELPEMDELIDRAGVGLEVADQLLVLTALFERGIAELRIELDGLGHLADVERVRPQLIECHPGSSRLPRCPGAGFRAFDQALARHGSTSARPAALPSRRDGGRIRRGRTVCHRSGTMWPARSRPRSPSAPRTSGGSDPADPIPPPP